MCIEICQLGILIMFQTIFQIIFKHRAVFLIRGEMVE